MKASCSCRPGLSLLFRCSDAHRYQLTYSFVAVLDCFLAAMAALLKMQKPRSLTSCVVAGWLVRAKHMPPCLDDFEGFVAQPVRRGDLVYVLWCRTPSRNAWSCRRKKNLHFYLCNIFWVWASRRSFQMPEEHISLLCLTLRELFSGRLLLKAVRNLCFHRRGDCIRFDGLIWHDL